MHYRVLQPELMATIQLQILSGPTKGRRPAFDQGPVRFGREHDNDVQVVGAYVSRQHGELLYEDGQWLVANHSANGLQVNGRNVKKPVALQSGDIVGIGDDQLFRVVITADDAPAGAIDEETDEAADQPAATPKFRLTGKARLYVTVGSISCVMMLLLLIAWSIKENKQEVDSLSDIPQLTDEQIEREIRTPPEVTDRLPAEALDNLQQARLIAERPDSAPDALYRAHRHYQLALAYSGRTTYEDNIDTLRADEIKRELVAKITNLYRTAYAQVRSRQYREALETMGKLSAAYPAPNSGIYKNVEQQRAFANEKLGRRR